MRVISVDHAAAAGESIPRADTFEISSVDSRGPAREFVALQYHTTSRVKVLPISTNVWLGGPARL